MVSPSSPPQLLFLFLATSSVPTAIAISSFRYTSSPPRPFSASDDFFTGRGYLRTQIFERFGHFSFAKNSFLLAMCVDIINLL